MATVLGQKIRSARTSANLSQSQLATKIGAHFTSVSDWERGKNAPSARHLISIAEATGTDLAHFTASEDEDGGGDSDEEDAELVAVLMRMLDRRARRASRDELYRALAEARGAREELR